MNNPNFPTETEISSALLSDQPVLRHRLQRLKMRRKQGKPFGQGVAKLRSDLELSKTVVRKRCGVLPDLRFPSELPISERVDEIIDLLQRHQVMVLCGETGSGKSTQLPKLCLAAGRGRLGRIGHTQPRRIAARSLATRIAAETGTAPGDLVGYKVRFHDHVQRHTAIKLVTDGMLLAEVQGDRDLLEYDTLIIDEAHERSLNIDFLLGYLKQLLPRRPDLKLIITSATIDPEKLSAHFDKAPIINVSGRTYPVEVRYRPTEEPVGNERDEILQQAIVEAVDELSRIDRGDILIFLSGEREIRETTETLRKHKLQLTELLPLYARLSGSEQSRIFNRSGKRHVVLATNVAETSLTVPGIRYVIDTGFARISRYSHRSKVQRLPVERISQASAEQRKGRCGRVAEGVCIRIYDEEDFNQRAPFTDPEIQRTNLASVILQMLLLGFGEIQYFPFVDKPDKRMIKDGYRILEEIGAVSGDRKVTRIGRQIARLPVDPRFGRMLFTAAHTHCLDEVLVITAALSVQDPRDRPMEKQQQADEAHQEFRHEHSDFLGYVNLWRHLQEQRKHLSKRKFINYCKSRFLSWTRVTEWQDIHYQLRGQLHEMGYKENQVEAGYEEIHKALLTGLLSHVGTKSGTKERDYLGARNSRFHIFPGSALFKQGPKWVAAAELVETTRHYARTVAMVRPEWIESVAGHLLKHRYSEPHWEKGRGQVAGYQKSTLFGLVVVPRRKINYGPIDPVVSREIFIRSALVDGDFKTRALFWRHNQELREYVEELEHKTRRRDLLCDDETIYGFYAARIPEGIYTTPQFEQWLRKATREQPKLLHMRLQDLLQVATPAAEDIYPDTLNINGMQLPLRYHFSPGEAADGVTLRVPKSVLNQVTDAHCDWLVPGLLREKVIALIRGLPKSLRRSFVPVPDVADACLEAISPSDRPLTQVLSEQLKRITGVYVPEDAWNAEQLPGHLRMGVEVLDDKGDALAADNDLQRLKRRYGSDTSGGGYHNLGDTGIEREGLKRWDFDRLPERVEIDRGGIRITGFPALIDRGEQVDIAVLDSQENAQRETHQGLRRLFMLSLAKEVRYLRKNLGNLERLRLQYSKAPTAPKGVQLHGRLDIEWEMVALVVDLTFIEGQPAIHNRDAFEQQLESCRGGLMTHANTVSDLIEKIFSRYQSIRKSLSSTTQINWLESVSDIKEQMDALVYKGFLQMVPFQYLQDYPRYLQAIERRLEKIQHGYPRDRERLLQLRPFLEKWRKREQQARLSGRYDPRLNEIRWWIEEWRVSLFAQELGTTMPVSGKRLEARWIELGL